MTTSRKPLILFGIFISLFWFSLYSYVPTLSTYSEALGASGKMIGLILGSYGFTQMVLRIPLGIYSDTVNKRKIFIIIGTAFALISSLGMGLFASPLSLLIFRSLSGAAAATWVSHTVLFSGYFSGFDAPKAIGYANAYNNLGQVLAMVLGGLAAQHFGPQSPFMVAAAGALAAILLSLRIEEKKDIDRKPLRIPELLLIARDGNLLLVSGLAILAQVLAFGTVYGFTPVAAEAIGATPSELGMLTTLATLPGIFASALSGSFFTKHFGERKTILWGFIIAALSSGVIPFIKSMELLYLSQFIGGFGRGMVFPLLMGLSIKAVDDSRRATAMGFFQAIYGLGMFLGPVLVGFLKDTAGLDWGFWAIGIIGLIGAVVSGIYIQDHKRA